MNTVEACDKRRAFCARLKSERERRGRSLADIATSTKIKASLLDALERGDLSRWPKGIYRRSFFREYVADIGLHPDPFISEFLDVFADAPPASSSAGASTPPSEPVSFRIVFANDVRSSTTPVGLATRDLTREARLVAAAVDVLSVAAIAASVAAVAPVSFPAVGATLGAIAYLLFTFFNVTPGTWLLRRQSQPTPPAQVQTFTSSSLPYNAYAPSAGSAVGTCVSLAFRVRDALAGSLERVMEAPSALFSSQRRRDLESVRRRRAEAANTTSADEFSVT
jgi:hypothetical protein